MEIAGALLAPGSAAAEAELPSERYSQIKMDPWSDKDESGMDSIVLKDERDYS